MKKQLRLPNYAMYDLIDFWIVAPDNSFKSEGIEQGDLVAIYEDREDSSNVDEPRDLYLFNYKCETRLIKRDSTKDDVTIYFDDKNQNKITITWDEYIEKGREIGRIMFVLKSKTQLYDRKTILKEYEQKGVK